MYNDMTAAQRAMEYEGVVEELNRARARIKELEDAKWPDKNGMQSEIDLLKEERDELREAIGKPMEHPYTKAPGWNWMANHIASMRCPFQSDHQNEYFVKVQERVYKILRKLAVINVRKGNPEDE